MSCSPASTPRSCATSLGGILGLEFIPYTWLYEIPTYLWVEIIFYGPLIWLALHQVNTDVFGDVPTEPEALKKHRRLQFIGTVSIAIILYGVGIHVTDTIMEELESGGRPSSPPTM